ncbi:ubiquitin-like domain-containing CTD phosphatase 1 isoform X1 [Anthonomus grandis grandis]|uniref:ubiquitin-like domain-containing CTD phosphatase 1 isoform X1 n=1 Tax=Anthonomus grandis grandis TaxID=2921223 RepID=UPI002165A3AB|nr:ubiquitin-like domain-containing CTD phosphatase 1 isoform X1 [Anthonomus grandis grandis]
MDKEIPLIIKWSGKEYEILIEENKTVSDLKREIAAKTSVKPERQKLLNLKVKGKTEEQCKLGALQLKPNFKIMMMGSLEEDIQEANTAPKDLPQVLNDFDIDDEEIAIENRDIYLNKVARRVKEYEVKILNQLRPGKKLLVLDIDYTLFDHRTTAQSGAELMRPYLHEFLTSAYEDYDIVIWSATNMKWIIEKMKLLGVDRHPSYKIAFYMDSLAMISVQAPKYGMIDVKPLGVIWGKFEQYTPKNTIMFDDIRRNFIMNPKNGLKIRPFREAHKNRCTDNELLRLSKYIKDLAKFCDDFTTVNHKNWEKYKPKGRSSGEDTESDVRN